jgi:hypothetical protein
MGFYEKMGTNYMCTREYLSILSAQITKLFFTVKEDCLVGFEVLTVVTVNGM